MSLNAPKFNALIKSWQSFIQSKIARIIFNCKTSGDALEYINGRILHITELYERVIKKLCLKLLIQVLINQIIDLGLRSENIE